MYTILISSNFQKFSAAKIVLEIFKEHNKIDQTILSGTTKSNTNFFSKFIKFFRYLFFIGPLLNLKGFISIIKNVKKSDCVIFDSSHYNMLIPILKILYPSVKIKIIFHNNELIFSLEELNYYIKNYRFISFFFHLFKIPYLLLIRIIEKTNKVSIVFISTNDIKYATKKNNIEFFDLTCDYKDQVKNFNIDETEDFYFIGNNFFNNYLQVKEFKINYPCYKLNIFGTLNISDDNKIICHGTFDNENNLPRFKKYFLGKNKTGFPIKFLSYLQISDNQIHTNSWCSLNILSNSKVVYKKKQ